MRAAIFVLIAMPLVSGCSLLMPPQENEQPPAPIEEPSISHKVTFPGETLSGIALWYTGDPNNWQALLERNPHLKEKSLRLGDEVTITGMELKRTSPMPKDFVRKSTRKRTITAKKPKAISPEESAAQDYSRASLTSKPLEGQTPASDNLLYETLRDRAIDDLLRQY